MRKTPGLRFDGGQWIIDKRVKGLGRIFERTGFDKSEVEEAEKRFHTLIKEAFDKASKIEAGVMTFRDAAARHLREATKRSIGRDVYALEHLVVRVLAPSGSGSGCKGLSLKALREIHVAVCR